MDTDSPNTSRPDDLDPVPPGRARAPLVARHHRVRDVTTRHLIEKPPEWLTLRWWRPRPRELLCDLRRAPKARAHFSIKHELAGGEAYAMTGAKAVHNRIAANLLGEIVLVLRDRPCLVYTSDMRVFTRTRRRPIPTFPPCAGSPVSSMRAKRTS